tara:strand:- start:147 stop:398 length:252 start_codon:yes stop_codon:yes gene_type:complete
MSTSERLTPVRLLALESDDMDEMAAIVLEAPVLEAMVLAQSTLGSIDSLPTPPWRAPVKPHPSAALCSAWGKTREDFLGCVSD